VTDYWRTPETPAERIDPGPDDALERGFVASLRWLVAEGDARGVRRIAVELRALREALATLDETRAARDEQARRAQELDREMQAAIAMLGPATSVDGNGSLVQRLTRLRERMAEDAEARRTLLVERDAFRAMCVLMTQTRARVHQLLEETERERDALAATLEIQQARVVELETFHDDARQAASDARTELSDLRRRLRSWSGTVERALQDLARTAGAVARGELPDDPDDLPQRTDAGAP
jgi:chromosome segregation ATPase